ncbi:MAG: hypothetical protein BGN88_08155 [Clostridiales bacterium 43-6]|nr:MAG: hypothetical protein BGN88_08155 [Clostridiales bacterium 43-6]
MKRHEEHEKEPNHERWLLTYSDVITLLLVLFIVMYTMSTIDSKKFKAMAENMGAAFNGDTRSGLGGGMTPDGTAVSGTNKNNTVYFPTTSPLKSGSKTSNDIKTPQNFDEVYGMIKDTINKNGYSNDIVVEKADSYILLRFKESVLFYPNQSNMKPDGVSILVNITKTLNSVKDVIEKIQIEGHTAKVSEESNDNFTAWQLSADRAIAVLRYMVQQSGLPQSKMSIAGYARYSPIASNDTEAGRAQNRRVEIKITQVNNNKITTVATTRKTTGKVTSK